MTSAFFSVDVETAGPSPARHALLAIGAVPLHAPAQGFYVELQPLTLQAEPEAMAIHGLSLEALAARGRPPAEAMAAFEAWVLEQTPAGARPAFVGFNAAFDWMFVCDYFHRFLGRNPFGHLALDLRSYFAAAARLPWEQATFEALAAHTGLRVSLPHHALEDARLQAALFQELLD